MDLYQTERLAVKPSSTILLNRLNVFYQGSAR